MKSTFFTSIIRIIISSISLSLVAFWGGIKRIACVPYDKRILFTEVFNIFSIFSFPANVTYYLGVYRERVEGIYLLLLRFCIVHISEADLLSCSIAVDDLEIFLTAECFVLRVFPAISIFEKIVAFEPLFLFG